MVDVIIATPGPSDGLAVPILIGPGVEYTWHLGPKARFFRVT